MNSKRRFVAAAALAMVAATPLASVAGDSEGSRYRLEGTWDVVLTFGDGSEVKSVLTVIPGAILDAGSIVHSAELSLVPPNPTLPEQGSWRRTGRRSFVASYHGFSFDEALQPFGRIGFRHALTLGKNGHTFTGRAVFEVIDSAGNVLFSDDAVQSRGVRQRAEAP